MLGHWWIFSYIVDINEVALKNAKQEIDTIFEKGLERWKDFS